MPELTGKYVSSELKKRVYIITNKQLLQIKKEYQTKLVDVDKTINEIKNPQFNHDTTNPEELELKTKIKNKELEALEKKKTEIVNTLNEIPCLKRVLNEAEGHFLVAVEKIIVGHLTHFPLAHMQSVPLNLFNQNSSDTFILKPRIDEVIADTSISVSLHPYAKYIPSLELFSHLTLTVELPHRNKILNLANPSISTAYIQPSARPSDRNKRNKLLKDKAQTLEQLKNEIN